MNRVLVLILIILFPLLCKSQCYEVQQRAYYPDPYTGGFELGLSVDDLHSNIIELGFPFCFFGDTVTQFVISTNDYISFNTDLAGTGSPWGISNAIPDTNNAVPFAILAPWQDTNPGAGNGGISATTYGVPPYRRCVVSFNEIAMFSCTNMEFTNQVVIYESLNVIDINIENKPLCETWNDGAAIQGITNQDGTDAYVVPGRNFPEQWTAQYDSYRFTPVCDCPTDSLPELGFVPGKVFNDLNGDCQLDVDEPLVPFVRLDIEPGNGYVYSNQNGEFAILLEPGNYLMEHSPENEWYLVGSCPNLSTEVVVVADSNALDVCIPTEVLPYTDLVVNFGGFGTNACFTTTQHIQVCNLGTTTAFNTELIVQIPAFLLDIVTGLNNVSDTTWATTIDELHPGECISFNLTDSVPCDSTMIGTLACFSASLSLTPNEIDSTNNSFEFCIPVSTSYDPNDLRVESQIAENRWIHEELINSGDELTYMIRFQNTGTGPAYNVIIKDSFSPFLDHQTFEPIIASHQFYTQVVNGELSVHFLGINLPDSLSDPLGSQGFFKFKIQQQTGNQIGTIIENQAEIYFDFNEPVVTNSTYNEISGYAGIQGESGSTFKIYPNPTTGEIFISNSDLNSKIIAVDAFDLQGRFLLKETGINVSSVNLNPLNKGVYLLQIQTEKGSQTKRVIKN